jgi:hypothetical protein
MFVTARSSYVATCWRAAPACSLASTLRTVLACHACPPEAVGMPSRVREFGQRLQPLPWADHNAGRPMVRVQAPRPSQIVDGVKYGRDRAELPSVPGTPSR